MNRCDLPISCIVNDYNTKMNGVESFDQRLTAFDCKLISNINWISLYQFLLDIVLDNSVAAGRVKEWIPKSKTTAHARMEIVSQITEHIKREIELDDSCLQNQDEQNLSEQENSAFHLPLYVPDVKRCDYCNKKGDKIRSNMFKSRIKCSICQVYLCLNSKRNCFADHHNDLVFREH